MEEGEGGVDICIEIKVKKEIECQEGGQGERGREVCRTDCKQPPLFLVVYLGLCVSYEVIYILCLYPAGALEKPPSKRPILMGVTKSPCNIHPPPFPLLPDFVEPEKVLDFVT